MTTENASATPAGLVDRHHHIWRVADLPLLSGDPVPRIFGSSQDDVFSRTARRVYSL